MPRAGKPYRFTPDRQQAYLDALRNGAGRYAAARAVGISHDAVWRHCDREPAFLDAMVEAENEALDVIELAVYERAQGSWRAGVALLAAKRPEVWSQQRRVSITSSSTITTREERPYSATERLEHARGLHRSGAWSDEALAAFEALMVETGELPRAEPAVLELVERPDSGPMGVTVEVAPGQGLATGS